MATWSSQTSDVRALESPDKSTRRAATWYDSSDLKLRLSFSSAYSGNLHLYALDWSSGGRRETITVNDGFGPQTATLASDFSGGAWVVAPVNVPAGGTVSVTVKRTGGATAVLSGLFLDAGRAVRQL